MPKSRGAWNAEGLTIMFYCRISDGLQCFQPHAGKASGQRRKGDMKIWRYNDLWQCQQFPRSRYPGCKVQRFQFSGRRIWSWLWTWGMPVSGSWHFEDRNQKKRRVDVLCWRGSSETRIWCWIRAREYLWLQSKYHGWPPWTARQTSWCRKSAYLTYIAVRACLKGWRAWRSKWLYACIYSNLCWWFI